MWPRTKILEWLETPSGHQCVWDARICPSTTYQQPLNAVSTDFYIRKYKINHRHARLDLLFGTSSDLGDILAVQPFEPNGQPTHKHKEVMGNISVFLKLRNILKPSLNHGIDHSAFLNLDLADQRQQYDIVCLPGRMNDRECDESILSADVEGEELEVEEGEEETTKVSPS
uniref:Uncharacterized protein n=1 Tax=Magallana gigas TaxID=29159 RepID=A0A8W8MRM1_MAGGI